MGLDTNYRISSVGSPAGAGRDASIFSSGARMISAAYEGLGRGDIDVAQHRMPFSGYRVESGGGLPYDRGEPLAGKAIVQSRGGGASGFSAARSIANGGGGKAPSK